MVDNVPVTHLSLTCFRCGAVESFSVETQALQDFRGMKPYIFGTLQETMPYLTVNQMHILLTNECGDCFDRDWPPEMYPECHSYLKDDVDN